MSDKDCPRDKRCRSNECINPCEFTQCGNNAECFVEHRRPRCKCNQGFQGNPYDRCIAVGCSHDEDCADNEICDPYHNCQRLCSSNPCVIGAECQARRHEETCVCKPPREGDGYVYCQLRKLIFFKNEGQIANRLMPMIKLAVVPNVEPECKVDRDCPHDQSCVGAKCHPLCRGTCSGDLECSVIEDQYTGQRSVSCSCREGFVEVANSRCEPGK